MRAACARTHADGDGQIYGGSFDEEVSFEQVWKAIESSMAKAVHDELYGEMKGQVQSSRTKWKRHFLSVFEVCCHAISHI